MGVFNTVKGRVIFGAVLIVIATVAVALVSTRPVFAPAEPEEAVVASETVTAAPDEEPSPAVRAAYIPDPLELQQLPEISTLELKKEYMKLQQEEDLLNVSWTVFEDADYYVFCVLDGDNNVLQQDILWAEIGEWELPEYQGSAVLLLCYKDMGEDNAEDDLLVGAYMEETTSFKAIAGQESEPESTAANPQNKYYIIVDKEDYAFSAFTYDKNGEYTIKVKTFPCALGRTSRMTPIGTFTISSKGPWKRWGSGRVSPYYTRYTSGLYFHGPLYSTKRGDALFPYTYEEIGTSATSGCVRTTTYAAYWVYTYCPAGTKVDIVKSSDLVSNPGKPPIDPAFPKWDPTDPDMPEPAPSALLLPDETT